MKQTQAGRTTAMRRRPAPAWRLRGSPFRSNVTSVKP